MSGSSTDSQGEARPSRRKILRTGALFGSVGFSGFAWGAPPPWANALHDRGPHNAAKCFLKGAGILTAGGESKVEDLAVGDMLPTMFGGPRPIQWIGRYTLKRQTSSKPWPKASQPVRIARSALGPNVPHRDLYVSQAHALLIDGVLISAGCLLNGTTIALDDSSERSALEFFHIKLESHDVIIAEGAPVETLLSVDESAANFAEYVRRYGQRTEEDPPCLPILSDYRPGSGLKARFLSATSWMDRRRRIAAIRNRLAESEARPLGRDPDGSLALFGDNVRGQGPPFVIECDGAQ